MRFNLRPPVPEDVDLLSPKSVYSIGELGCTKDLIALSSLGRNPDCRAITFCLGDKPLGVIGSYRQWTGCAQIWAVLDEQVDSYPKELCKLAVVLLVYIQQKQELRRISLTVRSGYTKGNRFARFLGFDLEGRLVGYLHDGEDANLYARLF